MIMLHLERKIQSPKHNTFMLLNLNFLSRNLFCEEEVSGLAV